MKRKIILTALMLLALIILVSCNSCTPSSGQGQMNEISYVIYQDTVYRKTIVNDSAGFNNILTSEETGADMTYEFIIIKKIEPMQVDTTWKVKNTVEFDKLEKTEQIIKEQSRTIDSLMSIKKK